MDNNIILSPETQIFFIILIIGYIIIETKDRLMLAISTMIFTSVFLYTWYNYSTTFDNIAYTGLCVIFIILGFLKIAYLTNVRRL